MRALASCIAGVALRWLPEGETGDVRKIVVDTRTWFLPWSTEEGIVEHIQITSFVVIGPRCTANVPGLFAIHDRTN